MSKGKSLFLFALLAVTASSAFAQAPVERVPQAGVIPWGALGAAFLLGIAAAAGAMGQARAIAAAVEGIARNPSAAANIRLSMIIGLALIESLVIYALVIAYLMHKF